MSESTTAMNRAGTARERKLAFRGGGFAIEQRRLLSILAFVGLIALWQIVTGTGLVSAIFLPSPMRLLRALWDLAVSGDLWPHTSASRVRIGYGWFIGTAFGVRVGVMMGLLTASRAVGLPLVSALFPRPERALLPRLIRGRGTGEGSKVATLALSLIVPTVI